MTTSRWVSKKPDLTTITEYPEKNRLDDAILTHLQIKLAQKQEELGDAACLTKGYLHELGIHIDHDVIFITRENKNDDYTIWLVATHDELKLEYKDLDAKEQKQKDQSKADDLRALKLKDQELKEDQLASHQFGDVIFLGEGNFGKVETLVNAVTGEEKAIKTTLIQGEYADVRSKEILAEEAKCLKAVEQDAVLVTHTFHESKAEKEEIEPSYLIMNRVLGASLKDLLKNKDKVLPLKSRINLFKLACKHVAYLHHRGVVHCDLSLANLMCDELAQTVRAVDLGLAGFINTRKTKALFGPMGFISPKMSSMQQFDPLFDVYSMGRIARILFNFPTEERDGTGRILSKFDITSFGGFHDKNGLTERERAMLLELIEAMEASKFTMWQAFKIMEAFQKQWEHNHDPAVIELLAKKKAADLNKAQELIRCIHQALNERDVQIATVKLLEFYDFVNSKDEVFKVSIQVEEKFVQTLNKTLFLSAENIRSTLSKLNDKNNHLDQHRLTVIGKSERLMQAINLLNDNVMTPISAKYDAIHADPDITKAMLAALSTEDRFSCYAADLILPPNVAWPTGSKEQLQLFERCQFLDRFFDEKMSAWDFITEPVGTNLFAEIQVIAKDLAPTIIDEKELYPIISKLDKVLENEWQSFWKRVLNQNNNKPCEYRIKIIQDQLKFAFCSRAIRLMANKLKLKSDDVCVKWLHNVNLSRTNANLEAHQMLLKTFTLKQLEHDAASSKTNDDIELQSAITNVLKMYSPKFVRNTHGRQVGELALIFGIKDIPQRDTVEATAPAKFNLALCQAFNYQHRILFIETILIKSIKNWAKMKDKKNPLITDDTIQVVVKNLQKQCWQATNRDDMWKIISDQVAKKGHRLFKGLYVILEKEYLKHPEIVQSDQSKFVRAMVFRLANTPMPEQKEEMRQSSTKKDKRLESESTAEFAEFYFQKKSETQKAKLSQRVLGNTAEMKSYIGMFQPPKLPVKTLQQDDDKRVATAIPARKRTQDST